MAYLYTCKGIFLLDPQTQVDMSVIYICLINELCNQILCNARRQTDFEEYSCFLQWMQKSLIKEECDLARLVQ